MAATININPEFTRQFARMRQFSKRGLAEDVNQKAYSILIAASKLNKKADKAEIDEFFQKSSNVVGQKVRFLKSGGVKVGNEIRQTSFPPEVFAVVNWKRRKEGKPALRGAELLKAAEKEHSRRKSSVGFMRSGWLAAVANVARKIGKTVTKNTARRAAQNLGESTPAREGVNPTAKFWNDAFSKITSSNPPNEWAAKALQSAIVQETARMGEYVARKMEERARKALLTFLR